MLTEIWAWLTRSDNAGAVQAVGAALSSLISGFALVIATAPPLTRLRRCLPRLRAGL
jgi:hypothetical protein